MGRGSVTIVVTGVGVALAVGFSRQRTNGDSRAIPDPLAAGLGGITSSAAPAPPDHTLALALERRDADAMATWVEDVRSMARLRQLAGQDPASTVRMAREGNQRFPESPDAPERMSILIHALAEVGQASEARGEAEEMVNHYPDSKWVREIEQFTGAHRHRNVRLNDAGVLVYQ